MIARTSIRVAPSPVLFLREENDEPAVDAESPRSLARRGARWGVHAGVFAGSGAFDDVGRGGRGGMELARPTFPVSGNLQRPDRLLLG